MSFDINVDGKCAISFKNSKRRTWNLIIILSFNNNKEVKQAIKRLDKLY